MGYPLEISVLSLRLVGARKGSLDENLCILFIQLRGGHLLQAGSARPGNLLALHQHELVYRAGILN